MMRTSHIALIAVLTIASWACGPRSADQQARERAVLIVDCPVADATLWIDGRYVAEIRDLPSGLAVGPGRHRIQVRSDRHFAHYQVVELAPRQRLRIRVALAERLP